MGVVDCLGSQIRNCTGLSNIDVPLRIEYAKHKSMALVWNYAIIELAQRSCEAVPTTEHWRAFFLRRGKQESILTAIFDYVRALLHHQLYRT